jgi:hypothetical protein
MNDALVNTVADRSDATLIRTAVEEERNIMVGAELSLFGAGELEKPHEATSRQIFYLSVSGGKVVRAKSFTQKSKQKQRWIELMMMPRV